MRSFSRKDKSGASAARGRSFRGCITCRAHHVKCDETRPTCVTCADTGATCGGYTRRIFFDASNDGVTRYRQMLFTDEERELLNSYMLKTVPLHKASKTLASIEQWSEQTERLEICIGPFGAFRLLGPDISSESWQASLEELESSFRFEFDELTMTPLCRSPTPPIVLGRVDVGQQASEDSLWQATFQNAPLLLKHYANTLIPMMTPIRHQKTPWHILFLPSTKTTLATITLGQEAVAADLTTFFGILALSALALQHESPDHIWPHLSQMFKVSAIRCLNITLTHALDVPKRFKYKAILMAILTMVQVSMVDGPWDQTDELLIAAEKIIRLRGLGKTNKSRKVRILHHCYTYARILQESISMTSSRSPRQLELANVVEKSGVLVNGSDPPFFCLGRWQNLMEEFMLPKSWEVGENDLHLASPGMWEATLYGEIFDVPETWLNLLSQVIRLANLKETTVSMKSNVLLLGDFTDRAKALEAYISYSTRVLASNIQTDDRIANQASFSHLMQSALYSALLIYFYRRIYDLDLALLQSQVTLVKTYLSACKKCCEGTVVDALMWPAFIAGCEAADTELQTFFSGFFDEVRCFSNKAAYSNMRQLMHKVWRRREVDDKNSATWVQLLDNLHVHQFADSSTIV